jgi:hypothetical protein
MPLQNAFRVFSLLLASMLFLTPICFGENFAKAQKGNWFVGLEGSNTGPGSFEEPFADIAHAISVAADGDTVFVLAGQYSGEGFQDLVVEEKGLVIAGWGEETRPQIQIEAGHVGIEYVMENGESGGVVQSIHFIGGDPAVSFEMNQPSSVDNCRFENCEIGVLFKHEPGGSISNCQFVGCSKGIYADGAFEVQMCSFVDGGDGLDIRHWLELGFYDYGHGQVLNSVFRGMARGVYTEYGPNYCNFYNCEFYDVGMVGNGRYAIYDSLVKRGGGIFCEGTALVNNCVIDSCGTAISMVTTVGSHFPNVQVNGSEIRNCGQIACGSGIEYETPELFFDDCIFANNNGGLAVNSYNLIVEITNSLFLSNKGSLFICPDPAHYIIKNNTFFGDRESPIHIPDLFYGDNPDRLIIENNIFAFSFRPAISIGYSGGLHTISNNVFFKNFGGSLVGDDDPVGSLGNLYADPRFCQLDVDEPTLAADSICLPANHPSGLLIGASEMGCSEAFEFTEIYVSSDAESNGIGASPESPIGNIDVALDFLDPGGSVNFLEGTYESALQINKPLTFKAHSGDPALRPH